jgi:sec-independent protein translocase protein TatA
MGWPGPWELIIVLLIVVMLFGAKRIPEIMGGVGKGIRIFKRTMEGEDVSVESEKTKPSEPVEEKKTETQTGGANKAS